MFPSSLICVAHRGSPQCYPENTLQSFEWALRSGAQWVEFDVQLTQDLVPVVFHDANLKRMTGRNEKIANISWSELQQIKVNENFSIPSLEQVLHLLSLWERKAFVELKSDQKKLVDLVIPLIEKLNIECVIFSFYDFHLYRARKIAPQQPIQFLISRWTLFSQSHLHRLNPDQVGIHIDRLSPTTLKKLQLSGRPIFAYTVNGDQALAAAAALGIEGVYTDDFGVM